MSDEIDELTRVQAVIEGLSSPTSREFVQATRSFSDGAIAGAAAQIASAGGGGGATAGAARVLGPFPFAFDDAGLEDGITFYLPTVGDILLDAWIVVDTSFDGTTPKGDIGAFLDATFGWFSFSNSDLVNVAFADQVWDRLLFNENGPNHNVTLSMAGQYVQDGVLQSQRSAPGVFTSTDPILIVVSQDGTKGGASVGGTQGAGAVYLMVATPSLT